MKPSDLLRTADVLLSSGKGKPTTASLCRAVSSSYYALFHCLAYECANLLIGGSGAARSQAAWVQVYRALEHGMVKNRCKISSVIKKFPKEIEDFANMFIVMQEKRHEADYNPFATYTKSEVRADTIAVEAVISGFRAVNAKDRRAFCAYVLIRDRK